MDIFLLQPFPSKLHSFRSVSHLELPLCIRREAGPHSLACVHQLSPHPCLFNVSFPSGSCTQPQPLCCPGTNYHCKRGSCYCDEFCRALSDCCSDHRAFCNPGDLHAGSLPPMAQMDAVTDRGKPVLLMVAVMWTGYVPVPVNSVVLEVYAFHAQSVRIFLSAWLLPGTFLPTALLQAFF